MNKIILSNMVYVPEDQVNMDMVENNYHHSFYNEPVCSSCINLEQRHCYICDSCQAYSGTIVLYRKTKGYVGLPIGDIDRLPETAGVDPNALLKGNVMDYRIDIPMQHGTKFTGKLKENQIQPVKDMIAAKRGVLEAPPRTGKTVMAVNIILGIGVKTLVLTHQKELLQQFMEAFDTFTDHRDVAFAANRPVVQIINKNQDIDHLDVCLMTYQGLLQTFNKERLIQIRSKFGLIVVDEVHRASAFEYAHVVNSFRAKYKMGLTATTDRKDGKHIIGTSIIGGVTTSAKVKQPVPLVIIHKTGITPKNKCSQWHTAINWMANNTPRNELIVKWVVKDILDNRSILIPVVRVNHVHVLVDMINSAYADAMGLSSANVAEGFHGKSVGRDEILQRLKNGETKVLVGIRSMVQVGINVPIWSCLYEIMPISNEPNHYQEVWRICTPHPDKPRPIVRHFLDMSVKLEIGCLRTCMRIYKKMCELSSASIETVDRIMDDYRGRHWDQKPDGFTTNDSDMVQEANKSQINNGKKLFDY